MVRERTNWHCEKCGINKKSEPETLDCSHIMGRRHVGLRWHPSNAVSFCRGCHMWFTERPFDFSEWCREYLGEDIVSSLRRESNRPVKWLKADKDSIYAHMKSEHDKMLTRRKAGEMGRIDFAKHEIMASIGETVLADPEG